MTRLVLSCLALALVGCSSSASTPPELGDLPLLDGSISASGDLGGVTDLSLSLPLDLARADQGQPCPTYLPGGGGGMNRPMIALPGGMIGIGNPNRVTATVDPFSLDVFEVTVGAYRDCVAAGMCTAPPIVSSCNWSTAPGTRERQPMNCVTSVQASSFCRWVGRRLPRRAELIWAMWGTSSSRYPWGDTEPVEGVSSPLVCWQRSDGPCEVGSKPFTLFGAPSCQGFADLAGNIGELTSALQEAQYAFPETPCPGGGPCAVVGVHWNTSGPTTFRSMRDFSLFIADINPNNMVGFRCAR